MLNKIQRNKQQNNYKSVYQAFTKNNKINILLKYTHEKTHPYPMINKIDG